ncbi:MAG: type I methionyl aminopeptidase [Chloroflexi bacterium RBG_13_53_26]|nr:MAG: type I methionyl aminopeptidase [Chloroflexi bacterium RBG_13_53_26]
MGIIIKSSEEIAAMRKAGGIVARILQRLVSQIRPGMRTRELDNMCLEELSKYGAQSSFKGYRGFPAHICTSVNDEVVHGIPGERTLCEGDVVSIDVGVIYDGFQGDAAITVGVGEISPEARRLLKVTEDALLAGIAAAKDNARLGDVSAAIQRCVEAGGFSVVREYTGHGIGRDMHEEPQIPNFGTSGRGPLLRKGMTLAIEPMVNSGGWSTRLSDDQWTVTTADGSLSAHFEHTVAVTDGGPEILTMM